MPLVVRLQRLPKQHQVERIVNWGSSAKTNGVLLPESAALEEIGYRKY